jgi:acetyl/propionyl-CoA carboxylase alpha subunit
VRVDSGVREGGQALVYYDPLLAKVVAFGEHRDAAIARTVAALRDFPILGVRTNIPFLINVLEHPTFRSGDVDTGFLDREGQTMTGDDELPAFLREAIVRLGDEVGAADGPRPKTERGGDPWATLREWRV